MLLETGKKRVPRKYKKRPRGNHAFNLYTIKPRIQMMKKMREEEFKSYKELSNIKE